MHIILKNRAWITRDGTAMVTDWVLCCTVHTGDRSESGSVKSFGGGSKSQTQSHGSAGGNTALPGSPTA